MRTTTRPDSAVLTSHGVTVAYAHPAPAADGWACADHDPDVFFPSDDVALAEATAVCATCPLRRTCRTLGESRGESGVWGGVLLADGRALERVPTRGRPRKVPAA